MKKEYQKPTLELIYVEDVVATSGGPGDDLGDDSYGDGDSWWEQTFA